MTITIRLFAIVREQIGLSELTVEVVPKATVADAREVLIGRYPAVQELLMRVAFAINREYAALGARLKDGDELAVIPPVSGG